MAGSGKAKALWVKAKAALDSAGLVFSYVLSEYAGHETVLSRAAVLSGHTQIISVGGDGTIQKVVSGVYSQASCTSFCSLYASFVMEVNVSNYRDWAFFNNLFQSFTAFDIRN